MASGFNTEALERMKNNCPVPDERSDKFKYTNELNKRGLDRSKTAYTNAVEFGMALLFDRGEFYSHIMARAKRTRSWTLDTIAVGVAGGQLRLIYNPDFVALWSPARLAVILQHECLHVVCGHIFIRPQDIPDGLAYDRGILALAVDLAVNDLIENVTSFVPMAFCSRDLIGSAKYRETWTYYYRLLSQKFGRGRNASGFDIGSGVGDPGHDDADATVPAPIDDHGQWKDVGDGDVEAARESVAIMVKEAVDSCQGQGNMPCELMTEIEGRLRRPSVPTSVIVRGVIGSMIGSERRATMLRPGRRTAMVPGRVRRPEISVIWYLDDSGSMYTDDVLATRSELVFLGQREGVSVSMQRFACGIIGDMVPLDEVSDKDLMTRGHGGTDFETVFKHAGEHVPDVMVVATDGIAPMPQSRSPGTRVVWVLTNTGMVPDFGTVIRLPGSGGGGAVVEKWDR